MRTVAIEGPLDIEALTRALAEVRERSPARRSGDANVVLKQITVTQETYDRLQEEVRPYLKFKTNSTGTWFHGVEVVVGETNEFVIRDRARGFFGGKPVGQGAR